MACSAFKQNAGEEVEVCMSNNKQCMVTLIIPQSAPKDVVNTPFLNSAFLISQPLHIDISLLYESHV